MKIAPQLGIAPIRGIDGHLCFASRGDVSCPAVLLIAGMGRQMLSWSDVFQDSLAEAGYRVITYDHRDIGASAWMNDLPEQSDEAMRNPQALVAAYSLEDMAQDATDLLQYLGISAAHVVGASMGGMIAQIMAATRPESVLSLTLMRTSSGNKELKPPEMSAMLTLANIPLPGADRSQHIRYEIELADVCRGSQGSADRGKVEARAIETVARGINPSGMRRHLAAIVAAADRRSLLPAVVAPTLVVHGLDDRLVSERCAHELAALIPNARLLTVPGMGHELTPQQALRIAPEVLKNFNRTDPTSTETS